MGLIEKRLRRSTLVLSTATVLSSRTRRTERASEAPVGLKFDPSGGLVD
jgi:hypothetical protein